MATTVGKLATELGLPTEHVLDACKRTGVTAWSEHTPLDDAEAQRVAQLLQAGPPGAAQGYGGPGPLPPPPPPGYAPPPPGYAPPPPGYGPLPFGQYQPIAAPKKRSRAVMIVAIVVGGIVALGVLGAVVGPTEDEPSNEEEAGLELVVGDCWDDLTDPTNTDEVIDAFLEEKPCTDFHDAEVYAQVLHPALPGEPYPGDLAVSDFSNRECLDRFAAFVGIAYEQSAYDVVTVFPQSVGWERLDDREISCSIVALDGTPLIGSAQGTAR